MAIPNRLAVSGDDLVVHRFQTGSVGLASASDLQKGQDRRKVQTHGFWSRFNEFFSLPEIQSTPAVCIPPGARLLVQDIPSKLERECGFQEVEEAVFVQGSAAVNTFRDAVRFHNGVEVLLQKLDEGQRIRVLELSSEEETTTALREHQSMMEHSSQFRG
jgi:hypothetical protein